MRLFYASVLMLAALLTGCGGGGGGSGETFSSVVASRDLQPYENNPLYPQQWYAHYDDDFYRSLYVNYRIDADPDAHIHPWPTQTYTGRGIKICIIDDALDTTHEDLSGGIVETYSVITGNSDVRPTSGILNYETTDDTLNHGTEVTGVAAASSNSVGISGIAPEASIYFIQLPLNRGVDTSDVLEAFEKAKEWNVDVINCSWGSGEISDGVRDAIVDIATNGRDGKGTIVVFAAGNDDDLIGNDESSIPEVIAVGATNIYNERTTYSNYGPSLDIMAPGGENFGIATLDQMGFAGEAPYNANYLEYNDQKRFAGTSAAAPIVTGVVAQILQADPTLTREQVMEILRSSANKIGDEAYDDGRNDYYGYGKVNVVKALNLAR